MTDTGIVQETFYKDFGHILATKCADTLHAAEREYGTVDQSALAFARFLRATRKNAGFSIAELAEKAIISEAELLALEKGLITSRNIHHLTLNRLAGVLNKDVKVFNQMLGYSIPKPGLEGVPTHIKNAKDDATSYFGLSRSLIIAIVLALMVLIGAVTFSLWNLGFATSLNDNSTHFIVYEDLGELSQNLYLLPLSLCLVITLFIIGFWFSIYDEGRYVNKLISLSLQKRLVYATLVALFIVFISTPLVFKSLYSSYAVSTDWEEAFGPVQPVQSWPIEEGDLSDIYFIELGAGDGEMVITLHNYEPFTSTPTMSSNIIASNVVRTSFQNSSISGVYSGDIADYQLWVMVYPKSDERYYPSLTLNSNHGWVTPTSGGDEDYYISSSIISNQSETILHQGSVYVTVAGPHSNHFNINNSDNTLHLPQVVWGYREDAIDEGVPKSSIALGDLDNDGDLDVVGANPSNNHQIYIDNIKQYGITNGFSDGIYRFDEEKYMAQSQSPFFVVNEEIYRAQLARYILMLNQVISNKIQLSRQAAQWLPYHDFQLATDQNSYYHKLDSLVIKPFQYDADAHLIHVSDSTNVHYHGVFEPNLPITRGEAAKYLYAVIEDRPTLMIGKDSNNPFSLNGMVELQLTTLDGVRTTLPPVAYSSSYDTYDLMPVTWPDSSSITRFATIRYSMGVIQGEIAGTNSFFPRNAYENYAIAPASQIRRYQIMGYATSQIALTAILVSIMGSVVLREGRLIWSYKRRTQHK